DAVDRVPKGINYAANIGHSALRTWVMGERAFDGAAGDDDLAAMTEELEAALAAGAIGFTTSRSAHHLTADGRPVASRLATWQEMEHLAAVTGRHRGLVELALEPAASGEADARHEFLQRLRALAVSARVPVTFGVIALDEAPGAWSDLLETIDSTSRD